MTITRTRIVSLSLALLASSLVVILKGAGDEPYLAFERSDALVQVGVAAALIASWIHLGALIVTGVVRHDVSKRWLGALFVAALSVFCLVDGALGYVSDIERFVIQNRKEEPNQSSLRDAMARPFSVLESRSSRG